MIASYGLKFILIALVLAVLCCLGAAWRDSKLLFVLAVLFAMITIFLSFFYRNPARTIQAQPGVILSTADGKVLAVEEIENDYLGGTATKISIFLSVLDPHINRIPIDGRIDYVRYNPGRFFKAFTDKASSDNENVEVGMTHNSGKLVFKIIAGILARRIEYTLQDNQEVAAGDIFGMIHFGSRAEFFLPADVEVQVKAGDRVKAGLTIIGRVKES
ncbi:MAG: phosphatidylserine decarboxylase family protein [candidate division Zixibacteria bacterium]|nr:phosphatidylserine decarboxylase family protein [candidate division Zixibacteria bacterium]